MKAFEIIRADRLKQGKTLRKFAEAIKANASYYSKIERGVVKCPESIIEPIMRNLNYSKAKRAYIRFLIKANNAGINLFGGEQDIKSMPAFICTADGKPPTKEQIMNILQKFPEFRKGKLLLLKETNTSSSSGY